MLICDLFHVHILLARLPVTLKLEFEIHRNMVKVVSLAYVICPENSLLVEQKMMWLICNNSVLHDIYIQHDQCDNNGAKELWQ